MLERIQEVLRNRKGDDKGFSLVELAVVIVVIGILVAIAVPVFMGIQDGARKSTVEAAASNGSAAAAGAMAASAVSDLTAAEVTALNAATGAVGKLKTGDLDSVTLVGTSLDDYCVTAIGSGYTSKKGTSDGCSGTEKS